VKKVDVFQLTGKFSRARIRTKELLCPFINPILLDRLIAASKGIIQIRVGA
jgi:hypothetical protein